MRDSFYISPGFPRLIESNSLKRTIAEGVTKGIFGYGRRINEDYTDIILNESLQSYDVEISDDVYLILKELANSIIKGTLRTTEPGTNGESPPSATSSSDPDLTVKMVVWEGEVPSEKIYNFFVDLSSQFDNSEVRWNVRLEVNSAQGIYKSKLEEVKKVLRELGLDDKIRTG